MTEPHVCTPHDCPESGSYYVSAQDAGRLYLMAGPYTTHAAALGDVQRALSIADKHDGRAWFMSWGTVRKDLPILEAPAGSLNKAGLL